MVFTGYIDDSCTLQLLTKKLLFSSLIPHESLIEYESNLTTHHQVQSPPLPPKAPCNSPYTLIRSRAPSPEDYVVYSPELFAPDFPIVNRSTSPESSTKSSEAGTIDSGGEIELDKRILALSKLWEESNRCRRPMKSKALRVVSTLSELSQVGLTLYASSKLLHFFNYIMNYSVQELLN